MAVTRTKSKAPAAAREVRIPAKSKAAKTRTPSKEGPSKRKQKQGAVKKTPSPATRKKKRSTQSSKHHKTQDNAIEDATDKLNVLFSAPNRVAKPARGKAYTLNVLQKIAGMMHETEAGKAFAAELEGMEKDNYAGDEEEDLSVVEHTAELDGADEETRSEGVADTGEAEMNAETPRAEVRVLKVKVAVLEHKLEHLMDALEGAGIYIEMTSG